MVEVTLCDLRVMCCLEPRASQGLCPLNPDKGESSSHLEP